MIKKTNKIQINKFRLLLTVLVAMFMLSACDFFDNDEESAPNLSIQSKFTGNVNKGLLAQADVNFYHLTNPNELLFSTTTDDNGTYTAYTSAKQSGLYLVEVKSNENTSMLCDANNCGTKDAAIAFNKVVPANKLTDLTLKTIVFLKHDDLSLNNVNAQVNAITTFTTELLLLQLDKSTIDIDSLTNTEFVMLQRSVSQTVAALLGFNTNENFNIYNFYLVNLNNADEVLTAGPATIAFGLINAAFIQSADNTIVGSINNIIGRAKNLLVNNSSSDVAQWLDVHGLILSEAIKLTRHPEIIVSETGLPGFIAIQNIVNNGVNISKVDDSINSTLELLTQLEN